jgi:hypothetical protein
MLRVNIHAGRYEHAAQGNLTDWVDIAYERQAAVSDYKVVLFCTGVGAKDVCVLKNYPRWSTSLWDLVARAIAIALMPGTNPDGGELAPVVRGKRVAFAEEMCAILRYTTAAGAKERELGSMQIRRFKKGRGVYQATLHEDLQPSRSALPFVFAPSFLRPAELILRAATVALTGDHARLPPRPPLQMPRTEMVGGKKYVPIHRLREPARTGFLRWLHAQGREPDAHADARLGIVSDADFQKFLKQGA